MAEKNGSLYFCGHPFKRDNFWPASREPTTNGALRNRRSVWSINARPFYGAHFATFPTELIRPCFRISSKIGDFALDPFFGSGALGLVCQEENRKFIGIELNSAYVALAISRLQKNS
ncbi:MAG: site-specific DNA-methyltransferase, partial [Deltaproteobacteria bacterium]|nr:site-specific DNA-methyltransferase [Deltaproteobacteria bacterium]